MKGYAILNKKESLKLLCLRGGFQVKSIIDSKEDISGTNISNHIKNELNISNINMKINTDEYYTFYQLELKTIPLYFSCFFNCLGNFIGGILITYEIN